MVTQGDPKEEERLRKISPKWVEKLHVIDNINGGDTNGFLDIQGGITIADKVHCPRVVWATHTHKDGVT